MCDADAQDHDARKRGVPFYEPYLAELLAEARCNLKFTTDYAQAIPGAQVIFIAVGTPPGPERRARSKYLQSAARGIGEHLDGDFTVVVNKSTVPIGSGNWVGSLVREAYEQRNGRKADGSFAVASNPEFLREGSALHDSLYPDRVVIGADESADRGNAVHAISPDSRSDVSAAAVPSAARSDWARCR